MRDLCDIDMQALSEAARNLLCNCGGFAPGDDILICREDALYGWYDGIAADAVAEEAARLGMTVRICDTPPPGETLDEEAARALASSSDIVYFARIGDQDRFGAASATGATGTTGRRVMVYARTARDLASDFGRTLHPAMRALKSAVDNVLFSARHIEITCPRGTSIAGSVRNKAARIEDTTVRRFPLGVPAPVPAADFSGRVALYGGLTPTGNHTYDPAELPLAGTVMAHVRKGRIVGFDGSADDVAAVQTHYEHVADVFALDPYLVHSWHAGLHPGCRFFAARDGARDYWSNSVFSNPRMLHFHTCGTQPPGEISWNLVDATVRVDGVPLWDNGVMRPRDFAPLAACIDAFAPLGPLFPGQGGDDPIPGTAPRT